MGILSTTRSRSGSPQSDRFARLTVVVSDGQDFFLHQTRRTLAQLGVRDIHLAGDGAEALGLVRTHQPHLAIIDWDLDAIPGLEFTAFLRRAEGSPAPNLPIIMTMSSVDRIKISRAMSAGVNEILIKPVTADALMRRIVTALSQARKPQVATTAYVGPDRRLADHPWSRSGRGRDRYRCDSPPQIAGIEGRRGLRAHRRRALGLRRARHSGRGAHRRIIGGR